MRVHLIDGTYELFRHHYGQPKEQQGSVTGATRGVCYSVLTLLETVGAVPAPLQRFVGPRSVN